MAADLCGKVERLKPGYTITEAGQNARVSMLAGRPAAHRTTVSAAKTYSLQYEVCVVTQRLARHKYGRTTQGYMHALESRVLAAIVRLNQ